MSTLSVPLSGDLEKLVEDLVKKGYGSNKADVMRRALRMLAEEEAVQAVLRAQQEPTLKGDLRGLSQQL